MILFTYLSFQVVYNFNGDMFGNSVSARHFSALVVINECAIDFVLPTLKMPNHAAAQLAKILQPSLHYKFGHIRRTVKYLINSQFVFSASMKPAFSRVY